MHSKPLSTCALGIDSITQLDKNYKNERIYSNMYNFTAQLSQLPSEFAHFCNFHHNLYDTESIP